MVRRIMAAAVFMTFVGTGVAGAIEPNAAPPQKTLGAETFKTGPKGGTYESLMLSMAWSPTFCISPGGKSDREQCAGTKKYGFVAHGLWPQFPRGSGASHGCTGEVVGLTDKSVEKVEGIMPSHKLMAREWGKHGTCYGSDPATYFAKTRTAWDKVKIPARFKSAPADSTVTADQVRKAFMDANPDLPATALSISCHTVKSKDSKAPPKLYFSEVRLCMDKNLSFQACGAQIKDRCKGEAIVPGIK